MNQLATKKNKYMKQYEQTNTLLENEHAQNVLFFKWK